MQEGACVTLCTRCDKALEEGDEPIFDRLVAGCGGSHAGFCSQLCLAMNRSRHSADEAIEEPREIEKPTADVGDDGDVKPPGLDPGALAYVASCHATSAVVHITQSSLHRYVVRRGSWIRTRAFIHAGEHALLGVVRYV